jgi:hypothetical protein
VFDGAPLLRIEGVEVGGCRWHSESVPESAMTILDSCLDRNARRPRLAKNSSGFPDSIGSRANKIAEIAYRPEPAANRSVFPVLGSQRANPHQGWKRRGR